MFIKLFIIISDPVERIDYIRQCTSLYRSKCTPYRLVLVYIIVKITIPFANQWTKTHKDACFIVTKNLILQWKLFYIHRRYKYHFSIRKIVNCSPAYKGAPCTHQYFYSKYQVVHKNQQDNDPI